MSDNQTSYKPRHFRIYSHTTKTRILHIGDALQFERLHLDLWEYQKGQGAKTHVEFYFEKNEARLTFADMLRCSLPTDDKGIYLNLMTGTPRDGKFQARTLTIGVTDAKLPLFFEVMNCEGEPMGQGAVKPKPGAPQTRVRVLMDWYTARKIALCVLSHLDAWEAATYWARIEAGTWQPGDPEGMPVEPVIDAATGEVLNGQPEVEIVNGKEYIRSGLLTLLTQRIQDAVQAGVPKSEAKPADAQWAVRWPAAQIIEHGKKLGSLIAAAQS